MKKLIALTLATSTLFWSGCCSTNQASSTTGQHRLTQEELVNKAIGHLKNDNKITKDMLESPVVRDAAAVYFLIRADPRKAPGSNCALVLDSQTGEEISGQFSGKDALLKEYSGRFQ
jgi:hypothetical protein